MSPELKLALAVVDEAAEITLRYFRSELEVERKADNSPVTRADREAEQLIRSRIRSAFPNHGIHGEEYGEEAGDGESRWVIDPIDGTKSFVFGVPLYGVLLGLERAGRPTLGVAAFPATRETYWAERGEGAFRNGSQVRVSKVENIDAALVLCSSVPSFAQHGKAAGLERLMRESLASRTWGDAYGHCMVAGGRAEVMLDASVQTWDTCAVMPIVLEAGGTFTTFAGAESHSEGEAISTNGLLLDYVLEAFDG